MTHVRIRSRAGIGLAAALAGPALLLAACGGSGSTYGGGSSSAAQASGKSVTVETHSGGMGTYLTDGSGRSLYLFASDKGGKSTCSGSCASTWPPLTAKGDAAASAGATSSMLGTTTRSDGSTQVTYGGHPLYYYAGDSTAGDTKGEGVVEFGATWWLVAPSGASLTTDAGSGSSSPSTSSGGTRGGGWS